MLMSLSCSAEQRCHLADAAWTAGLDDIAISQTKPTKYCRGAGPVHFSAACAYSRQRYPILNRYSRFNSRYAHVISLPPRFCYRWRRS